MSSPEPVFYVNDSIHGSIELKGKALCYIIDTPEFQRLRKIKQLGGACYVYPGATHTRFDHSIGVCFIASELMNHLKQDDLVEKMLNNYKKVKSVDYEKCVKVAALCHDLGHGPYSHLYDFAIKDHCKRAKKIENPLMDHEHRSVEILNNVLKGSGSNHGITSEEIKIIGVMITFSKRCKDLRAKFLQEKYAAKDDVKRQEAEAKYYDKICKRLEIQQDLLYLFEIVANGFTEIDVDKMDYFIRDGRGLGLSSFFDWRRYIQTLRVCEVKLVNEQNVKQTFQRLCSRDKEALELYQLFHIRNQLFRQAYRHKTTIAVEHMIKDAMTKAHEWLTIAFSTTSGKKELQFLDAWQDMAAFSHLTDSFDDIIMEDLKVLPNDTELSDKPRYYLKDGYNESDVKKVQDIIHNIRHRKLIKLIGKWKLKDPDAQGTDFNWEEKEKKIFKTSQEAIEKELKMNYKEDEMKKMLIIETAVFHYGMQKRNPIQEHYFYKKIPDKLNTPQNIEPFHLPEDEVSEMLPKRFHEQKLMVYCDFHQLLKEASAADQATKRKKITDTISEKLQD